MDESLEEDMYNFLAGLLTAPCYQMVDNSPSREMVYNFIFCSSYLFHVSLLLVSMAFLLTLDKEKNHIPSLNGSPIMLLDRWYNLCSRFLLIFFVVCVWILVVLAVVVGYVHDTDVCSSVFANLVPRDGEQWACATHFFDEGYCALCD